MIKLKRTKGELIAKFDTAKSFYNKAQFEEVETDEGNKIYLLYSYNSLVCGIVAEKDSPKWIYLNNNIQNNLLLSQTTLRHIKEFARQFYKDEKMTKAELEKIATRTNFDFLLLKDTNMSQSFYITDWGTYYQTTSPEQKKFFKDFEGYRERQTTDTQGKHLFTKCKYGWADYHFLNI